MSLTAPASRSIGLILATLLAAEFTSAFELTMIYSGMKVFMEEFRNPIGVGWLITSYLLVGASAAAICGRLGDLYGRKRVLLIMLSLAATGSIISAASTSLMGVILGRGLQGFAGAVLPLCYGLVRENLPAERVPFGVAILASSVVIAAGCGMVVGGILVDNFSWHAIFVASGSMAIVSLVLSWLILPASRPQEQRGPLDLRGGLLFAPSILMILLAVTSMTNWGIAINSPFWPLMIGGLVLLAIWIRHELRVENPLIDLRLLGAREVAIANLAMCAYALGPQQAQLMALLMQQPSSTGVGLGYSATFVGLVGIIGLAATFIIAPLAALGCQRLGSRAVLIVAGATLIGSLLCHYPVIIQGMIAIPLIAVVASSLFMQVGSISLFAAAPNVVIAAVPAERTSEATGMMQVNRSVAQAIGSQILSSLLATSTVIDPLTGKGPFPSMTAYLTAAIVMTVLGSGTLICALMVRERRVTDAATSVRPSGVGATPASQLQ